MTEEHIPLSASRIKTLKECSWIYYCKYILGMPEKTNTGSSMGWICHLVFECLGNPRHKKHYSYVRKKGKFNKPLARMVKKHADRLGANTQAMLDQIENMASIGVRYDFFCKHVGEPDESHSELAFDISKAEDGIEYRIKGFLDKLFLFKDQSLAVIRDFKSSKKVFSGEDVQFNLQDYVYALAVKHLYPDVVKRRVEFLFLQHDSALVMEEITDETLHGFEQYLTSLQTIIDSFSEKDAESNMAYDQGWVSGGSFSGKLRCGTGRYKNEPKKDGSPKWACPFKWGFNWYILLNEDGSKFLSCFEEEKEVFEKLYPDKCFQKQTYSGCPRWLDRRDS